MLCEGSVCAMFGVQTCKTPPVLVLARYTCHLGLIQGTQEGTNIMACSLFIISSRNGCEHYHCLLFVVLCAYLQHLSRVYLYAVLCVPFECVFCVYFQFVFCFLFLVCVLFLFLVCVMCRCTLASLRSAGARFARCGRFAAAAAASRPQAITPNIIVFVVRGLTFVNVSALALEMLRFRIGSMSLDMQ